MDEADVVGNVLPGVKWGWIIIIVILRMMFNKAFLFDKLNTPLH